MFLRTDEFDAWLSALKDKIGRARIAHRIWAAEHGNCEAVSEGISVRVYFTQRGEVIYLLLLGGDKSSQKRDIKRAISKSRALDAE